MKEKFLVFGVTS